MDTVWAVPQVVPVEIYLKPNNNNNNNNNSNKNNTQLGNTKECNFKPFPSDRLKWKNSSSSSWFFRRDTLHISSRRIEAAPKSGKIAHKPQPQLSPMPTTSQTVRGNNVNTQQETKTVGSDKAAQPNVSAEAWVFGALWLQNSSKNSSPLQRLPSYWAPSIKNAEDSSSESRSAESSKITRNNRTALNLSPSKPARSLQKKNMATPSRTTFARGSASWRRLTRDS